MRPVFRWALLSFLLAAAWLGWRGGRDVHRAGSTHEPESLASTAATAAPAANPAVAATTNRPAVDHAATDSLEQRRRLFRSTVRDIGTPDPARLPIELEGLRIYAAGMPRAIAREDSHARHLYLIQFTGPTEPAWKSQLEQAGGILHGYLPHHAWAVELTPDAARQWAKRPMVQGLIPYQPDFKIQPFLHDLIARPPASTPRIAVTISTFAGADAAPVAEAVARLGGDVQSVEAGQRWGWVRAEVALDRLPGIAALPRVQWIEEYVAPRIVNDQAVIDRHLRVTNVWSAHGLTGAGQIIGHADTGLDRGSLTNMHPDFAGRVLLAFDRGRPGLWNDPNGHGTHTAGSLLGAGTLSTGQYRGVAWQAQLIHQSLLSNGGGLGGLPANLNELFLQAYTNGARIHANSWGSSVYGQYTTYARQADEFMWDHPDMLLVFAAGNDGYDTGDGVIDPGSVGAPATAKNLLSVGASEGDREPDTGGFTGFPYGYLWPFDYPADPIHNDYVSTPADGIRQGMAAFSSRGPTEDGRIKPDVVAPGTDVISVRSRQSGAGTGWGVVDGNTNYNFNGGTSMSTPMVAGAAALVRQYFQQYRNHAAPGAALLKAALLHGARSLTPGQYGDGDTREIPAATPNIVEGWGQVDVEGTLFPGDASWFFVDGENELAAPGDRHDIVFFAQTGTVAVTLNYNDFPATAGSGPKMVNDLDLSLHGPDGFASLAAGPDRTNAAEQLRAAIAIPGVYTARVTAANVPQGPQPFALIVSGPVADMPVIEHAPLPNTFITNQPYQLETRIRSSAIIADGAARLYWRDTAAGTNFTLLAMSRVTNNQFATAIPAHGTGTTIEYYLEAESGVFVTRSPAAAPATAHRFDVTQPMTLTVAGSPAAIFSVTPSYGQHLVASGNTVRLTAPAFTNLAPGMRLAIDGWVGSGSVPATGATNLVDVAMHADSAITWLWVTQYELAQTSSVAGVIDARTWWDMWDAAATIAAPAEPVVNSVNYGLAGWLVDGQRWPNAASIASNPAAGIVMYAARGATARYLPAAQDLNANQLPDWWEEFYFGTNNASAAVDNDGDGFTNLKEFQDRRNPRDPLDIPAPPAVAHVPLADPQPRPAPWTVQAVIADNHSVNQALVAWQRNGGPWTSAPLAALDLTNYAGAIAAPGGNGDTITYRIEATDGAGLTTVNGPYTFTVKHPVLASTPNAFGDIGLPAHSATSLVMVITNAGLATLEWQAACALYFDHIEDGVDDWSSDGFNNAWNVTSQRFASATQAWHFGDGPGGTYPDNAHAWIISPPVRLDAPARLLFDHWARMEYDMDQQDDHYWDGAVVELSTDDGATFVTIEPEGGYPHRITDNPASPFPPDTPCYGETEGWETAVFDLAAFTGQTVRFRFRFGSDGYVVEEGWYIDNVRVQYQDPAAWSWLAFTTNGAVAAQQATGVVVTLDSATLAPAEQRRAVIVLNSNDPTQGAPHLIPVTLDNISRMLLVTHDGPGTVAPSGAVLVVRGSDAIFALTADPFYVVDRIYTNGADATGFLGSNAMTYAWLNVQSNGTLHVAFAVDMVDGLVPAEWLHEQGLTNDTPEVEAHRDGDGDGMTAWQEYRAVTDPNDPESVAMTVIALQPSGEAAVVEWLSFTNTGWRYTLEAVHDAGDAFLPLATNLPATPPVNVFTSPPAPMRVFRVLAVP